MPTYGYTANPRLLTQEELDALAAEQLAMGGSVPAGGYTAEPDSPAAGDVAAARSRTTTSGASRWTACRHRSPATWPRTSATTPTTCHRRAVAPT